MEEHEVQSKFVLHEELTGFFHETKKVIIFQGLTVIQKKKVDYIKYILCRFI